MTMDVTVKYGANAADQAGRLLSAARKLDLPTNVVVFSPDGHYTVPEEVAEEAGVSYDVVDSDEPSYVEGPEAEDLEVEDADADEDADEGEPEGEPADVVVPQEGEEGYLAGKSLEEALKERGLPSKGKADDKRLAVATHDAKNKE
jgi:hypothetical protein